MNKKELLITGATLAGFVTLGGVQANADQITVKRGDTLNQIAATYNTTAANLAAINHIVNPNLIYVGQIVDTGTQAAATNSTNVQPQTSSETQVTENTTDNQTAAVTTDASSETNAQVEQLYAKNALISTASQYIGVPYVWGGSTPSGFDCSGLVQYVRNQLGFTNLGRTTYQQAATLRAMGYQPKTVAQAEPGDLLFWGGTGNEYHEAIYIGNGQMLVAPQPGMNVEIENVWGNPQAYSFTK
jgi:cell wall-associated NlpC family hydrolase